MSSMSLFARKGLARYIGYGTIGHSHETSESQMLKDRLPKRPPPLSSINEKACQSLREKSLLPSIKN